MKKILGTTVALAVMAIFISSAQAAPPVPPTVIKIETAMVQNGLAFISGKGAALSAAIKWDGSSVTTANKNNGGFSFFGVLPDDCKGELTDGVQTVQVTVLLCTPKSTGGVLQTGQTACYDAAGAVINPCANTGQDGEFKKGTARSYTDNLDGTITDNSTGLVWEKLTNDATIHNKDDVYTWANAFNKIAALNAANFAGYHDWRLPNINELHSLIDYGKTFPARAIDFRFIIGIDGDPKDYAHSFYWSSTSFQNNPAVGAWLVDFMDGWAAVGSIVKTDSHYVRAVRGGS